MKWFKIEGDEFLKRYRNMKFPFCVESKKWLSSYIEKQHMKGKYEIVEITHDEATKIINNGKIYFS